MMNIKYFYMKKYGLLPNGKKNLKPKYIKPKNRKK